MMTYHILFMSKNPYTWSIGGDNAINIRNSVQATTVLLLLLAFILPFCPWSLLSVFIIESILYIRTLKSQKLSYYSK